MDTLKLLESNPHYLQYKGKPTVLVGSGEHYGAVLNLDFDYVRYLDAVAESGLNLTRTLCGTYREVPSSFSIANNTLAPQAGKFCCAWQQADRAAAAGEEIYDLSKFSARHTDRLCDFLAEAQKRDIFVELVLFCFLYEDALWLATPMHPARNTASIGSTTDRLATYDTQNAPLLDAQLQLTRKIVTDCNEFDNVYFELMNEPYSLNDGRDYDLWQNCIAEEIVATEADLPKKHLIARNYENVTKVIDSPHPAVSIINFHYAAAEAARCNFALNLPIADDETGFKGQTNQPYRQEAWLFMLAGGAIFSHLDYSFTVAAPDGTAAIENQTPGSGSAALRSEFKVLKDFLAQLPLEHMRPANEYLKFHGTFMACSGRASILSDRQSVWALYLTGGHRDRLPLGIPAGEYQLQWLRPADGYIVKSETFQHDGAVKILETPIYSEDIAMLLKKSK